MIKSRNGLLFCICRKDYIAYADVCFREFGDWVLHWTTFNEAVERIKCDQNFLLQGWV
ncbi:putative cyanidin 3-O-glucoside 5-O-glucosyltransferase (acyl-glucose) [Helianthus annuus]|nr:putative cyanidin 3-O-glucoside 5-O-glucosyltransferase (acyl-glucose) [Helianthus annuus]